MTITRHDVTATLPLFAPVWLPTSATPVATANMTSLTGWTSLASLATGGVTPQTGGPAVVASFPTYGGFTDTFETVSTGWSKVSGYLLIRDTARAHSGSWSLSLYAAPADTGSLTARRTMIGLTVGQAYRISFWLGGFDAPGTVTYSVTGMSGTPVTAIPTAWTQLGYVFTATSTTHTLEIAVTFPAGSGLTARCHLDDVTLDPVGAEVTVSDTTAALTAGTTYRVRVGLYSADTSQVSVSYADPNGAIVRAILTARSVREVSWHLQAEASTVVPVVVRQDTGGHGAAAVGIAYLAFYEVQTATVLDLRPTAADVTLDEGLSPYVSATLTCPVPDVDVLTLVDPRRPQRVRIHMAQATGDSLPLSALADVVGAATDLADFDAWAASLSLTHLADMDLHVGTPFNPGEDVTHLDGARTLDLLVRERSVNHVSGTMTLRALSDESALHDWARFETTTAEFTPPVTSSLGELVRWGLAFYGWDLTTTTDATIDSADAVWNLGESLWSFLDTFVRGAGLRLWCDEARRWHLAPAATAEGVLVVDRPTSLVDTISRDADDWGTAVATVYSWTDNAGLSQRATGYASDGSPMPKTVVHEWQTRGTTVQARRAAEAMLSRVRTRGRPVQVGTVSDYRATPGMPVQVAAGGVDVTGAIVSAVEFAWPDDEMTLRTRDEAS